MAEGDIKVVQENAGGTYDEISLEVTTDLAEGETAASIAAINHGTAVKSALVNADEIVGQDSADTFSLIRTTWTSVKSFLKTYFDTLYETLDSTIIKEANVDDTPVDAATTDPISSNWAYDHAVGETANLHTKVGTIVTGTWEGTAITQSYIGASTINPSKLDDEFKTIVALGAGVAIDWSAGQTFTKTLAADPTFTFSNLHVGVKFIETTGDYAPTFPTGFTYVGGTRAATGTTVYQIVCTNTSTPVGYYSIFKDES